jgi:16S rRNA (cytosine1402-N4)-methyltransferase
MGQTTTPTNFPTHPTTTGPGDDRPGPTQETRSPNNETTGSGSLIRSLSVGTMEGPYSARFPSSPIGEKSRRASAGRRAADERSTCPRIPKLRLTTPKRRSCSSRADTATAPRPAGDRAAGTTGPDREGTDMAGEPTFHHQPVMVAEITALFAPVPTGIVVDATLGGGGHTRSLLANHPHLRVVGIDQDEDALAASAGLLDEFPGRVVTVRSRFDRLAEIAAQQAGVDPVVGVLFDLGVSSPQLDRADRGFSYRQDAPLDMRMDRSARRTAADVVNTYDETELAGVMRDFGDERFAGRIARAVVAARPVTSTVELAAIVRDAIPAAARRRGGHPAKRTFQAIRIEVNRELDILPGSIDQAIDVLAPGGRIAVLAYHSGEDRIVKDRLRQAETGGCECPPGLPCACGAVSTVRLLKRGGWTPSPAEIEANPRAESARLRAAERRGPNGPASSPDPMSGGIR